MGDDGTSRFGTDRRQVGLGSEVRLPERERRVDVAVVRAVLHVDALAEVLRAVRIDSATSLAPLLGRDGARVIAITCCARAGRAVKSTTATPSISQPAISSRCRTGIPTGSATGGTSRRST